MKQTQELPSPIQDVQSPDSIQELIEKFNQLLEFLNFLSVRVHQVQALASQNYRELRDELSENRSLEAQSFEPSSSDRDNVKPIQATTSSDRFEITSQSTEPLIEADKGKVLLLFMKTI